MTRDQKHRLAWAVMQRAATMIEFWEDAARDYGLEDIDRDDAARQVATWMHRLPGDSWDTRLPLPGEELLITVGQGYRAAAREALRQLGGISDGAYTDGSTTWTFLLQTRARVTDVEQALYGAGIAWCNVRPQAAEEV